MKCITLTEQTPVKYVTLLTPTKVEIRYKSKVETHYFDSPVDIIVAGIEVEGQDTIHFERV